MKWLKVSILIILSIMTASAKVLSASEVSQHDTAVKPISEIFDKDVLVGCNFRSPYFIDFYMSNFDSSDKRLISNILHIDNRQRTNLDTNITTGLNTLRVSGIKDMKDFKRNTDARDESIWSIDIDVYKHDMHILRFAKFGIDDHIEGVDYGGYYYVVKGSPQYVIPKLRQLDPTVKLEEHMTVEKTKGNNTRVRCIF